MQNAECGMWEPAKKAGGQAGEPETRNGVLTPSRQDAKPRSREAGPLLASLPLRESNLKPALRLDGQALDFGLPLGR